MQMDSHMVPSVWTNLEHSHGVNYRLVATDKVPLNIGSDITTFSHALLSTVSSIR